MKNLLKQIRVRVIKGQELLKNRTPPAAHELNTACQNLLREAVDVLALSPRAHQRVIKIAHTISALSHRDSISEEHLAEALSYR